MLVQARALRDSGVPIPKIAEKLTIATGKNAGKHPSVASLYRALSDDAPATAAPDDLPWRPRPARILQDDEPTPEEEELRQRPQDQPRSSPDDR